MSYGNTPVDAGSLPLSSGFVPGASNPTPVGGTASYTDTNSNTYTAIPVADLEEAGYQSLTSPAAATTANTDTSYTFSAQVTRVTIQNNSTVVVKVAFDAAATAGSLTLQPGATLSITKRITVVHFLTVPAVNVNGSTAGNIVLLGVK